MQNRFVSIHSHLAGHGEMGFIFNWWLGLSSWLRAGMALLLIGISIALWWFTKMLWLECLITGVVLLIFSGPSDSEKNGYHF